MGKRSHDWLGLSGSKAPNEFCSFCGVMKATDTFESACPPWDIIISDPDEGKNTKAKRIDEAQEVKNLKEVVGLLDAHCFTLYQLEMMGLEGFNDTLTEPIEMAKASLRIIIQKREGLD